MRNPYCTCGLHVAEHEEQAHFKEYDEGLSEHERSLLAYQLLQLHHVVLASRQQVQEVA